jgi:hypothetical protein
MASLARFFIGGLGGLLPILVMIVTLDIAVLSALISLEKLTLGVCVGFGARVVGLFILGGVFAWANKSVTEPLSLLQIGIAAPALVTSFLSGAAVAANGQVARPIPAVTGFFSIVGTANAATLAPEEKIVVAGFLNDFNAAFNGSYANRQIFGDPVAGSIGVIDRGTGKCTTVIIGTGGNNPAMSEVFPSSRYDVRPGACEQ